HPAPPTYTADQTVTLTSPTANTVVRYTVDGTDPTPSSLLYSGPIGINTFTVLKAKAFRDAWTPSLTATTTFTFNYGTLAAPTANPPGGLYPTGQLGTLSPASGPQVRYRLDGTDLGGTSAQYGPLFRLPD